MTIKTTTNTNSTEKTFSLAVIGCGDIAVAQHLPALSRNRRVHIAAVCDREAARAEAVANTYGIDRWTDDHREILANADIEAVVVATPPWVTPRLVIEALEAGKDVLCEKPLGLSVEDACLVADAEKATGQLVQVGFTYRHGKIMETLRRWIGEGRLGTPLLFRIAVFDEVWDPDGNAEHYRRILATLEHGAPCIHDGAHCADHLHFLSQSRAVRVQAHGVRSRPEFPAPNYNVAHIAFANGDTAILEIGWFYPQLPPGHFEILGPQGIARFDRDARMAELQIGETIERISITDDWFKNCFVAQLDSFLDALASRRTPVPGTAEGIASIQLTRAIQDSMSQGTPVEISKSA